MEDAVIKEDFGSLSDYVYFFLTLFNGDRSNERVMKTYLNDILFLSWNGINYIRRGQSQNDSQRATAEFQI